MKQIMRSILLSALVIAWTGLAQAEDAPKKKAPKGEATQCEIVSVNAEAKTIDVKAGGKTETLTLSKSGSVTINGEKKALTDLKPGDKCTCTVYNKKDGSKSVSRIAVGDDPKAKEPKKTE